MQIRPLITLAAVVLALAGQLSVAHAQSTAGFTKGIVTRSYSHSGVAMLDSFYFRFTSSDHHLTQIAVQPDRPYYGRIRLGFHDKNQDDNYYYKVSHHPVSNPQIRSYVAGDICVGRCTRTIAKPAGNYVFVLLGFRMYYNGGRDHHVDQIGVVENNGKLTVSFNDKNKDDQFFWTVDYAYVPAGSIQRTGVSSDYSVRGGSRRWINSGRSVISGFFFNFRSSDHHIKDVGVMTPSGRIEAFYGDKNQDDAFDWTVKWAILSNTNNMVGSPLLLLKK